MEKLTQKKAVTILRILYPVWMVFGMFGIMYVPSQLIVSGDSAATATNILSNQLLFRGGIIGSLITQLLFIFAAFYTSYLSQSIKTIP